MQNNEKTALEYSYLSLPNLFYELAKPALLPKPEIVLRNDALFDDLKMILENDNAVLSHFFNQKSDEQNTSFAQAYAGSSVWTF